MPERAKQDNGLSERATAMTTTNTETQTILGYGIDLVRAGDSAMVKGAVAVAMFRALASLPATDARHVQPGAARDAVKTALDTLNSNTSKVVAALSEKLDATLRKQHGKPGATVEGQRAFWDCLSDPDHATAIAMVEADMKATPSPHTGAPWDGTVAGLRAYVGFKPPKDKTELLKFLTMLKGAIKRADDGKVGYDDVASDAAAVTAIADAMASLNTLLTAPATKGESEMGNMAEAA